jgi:hypothetical protein
VAVGEEVTVHSKIARLTSRLFLIRAQGTRHDASGAALATRTLGMLVQLVASGAPPQAEAEDQQGVSRLAERGWVGLY